MAYNYSRRPFFLRMRLIIFAPIPTGFRVYSWIHLSIL